VGITGRTGPLPTLSLARQNPPGDNRYLSALSLVTSERRTTDPKPLVRLALGALTFAAVAVGVHGYRQPARHVHLVLNGDTRELATRVDTVSALIDQLGLALTPADYVWPSPEASLSDGDTVRISQARRVRIDAGGFEVEVLTQHSDVMSILSEAGIAVSPADKILVDERVTEQAESPPSSSLRTVSSRSPRPLTQSSAPQRIIIQRAVPFVVSDDGVESTLVTTAGTVGEALLELGIQLYLGDTVVPDQGTPLVAGTHAFIERSTPIEIQADGRKLRIRTRAATVGEALAQENVALIGQDYCTPGADAAVSDGLVIQVVRVHEEALTEQEIIPYQTRMVPDASLELDLQQLQREGENGLNKRRIRVLYHDGVEVARDTSEQWVAKEPSDKLIAYGTKVVIRELQTPSGPVQYWRKLRMYATSYTAANGDKERDNPAYGLTAYGWRATKGVIAVDPRVVSLGTRMYVPGYGPGTAADTGGGVIGRWVDLCYDEGAIEGWWWWTDVYLLAPAPPADRINYVLPEWPQYPDRGSH
jgi:uncharacterized protein YabE (DUF348 family)